MYKIYNQLFSILLLVSAVSLASAQTYNDGPIELQMRVRDIQVNYPGNSSSDFNLNVGNLGLSNFSDDELTFKLWGRDLANTSGLGWQGGNCLTETLPMLNGGPETTSDFNYSLFNFTYTGATVPQLLQVRIDAWEDDLPTDFALVSGLTPCGRAPNDRCSFDASMCCVNLIGCLFSEADDYHCDAQPYANINYRVDGQNNGIPPCQWFSHGYITGSNCASPYFFPKIETFWRYTKGTSCNPTDAIDLGTLTTSNTLVHYNSNECYGNNYSGAAGNDVYYTFDITGNIGVAITLTADCPASVINNTRLFLLDSNCGLKSSASGTCGTPAAINQALCTTGRYYVVVDGASQTDVGAFTISITKDPSFTFTATATSKAVTCNGGANGEVYAAPVGGQTPYTYQWSSSLGTNDTITGVSAGTYTVTITDGQGCSAMATTTVVQPTALGVTVTTQDVSCGGANDGSATAQVSGGTAPYSYTWNTSPVQTGPNAVLLGQGTYTVIVTDANGCAPVSETGTVSQSTTIIVTTDAVDNVTCNGANDGAIMLSVAGGQSPYTYTWDSSLPATQDQTGLAPGSYNLTVADNAGCEAYGTYVITEPTALVTGIAYVKDASCTSSEDGSADLTVDGGTPPYTYLWSNGSVLGELFDVAAGTYTVTVTDANSCTQTQSVTIDGPANPLTSSIAATGADCSQGITGSADLTVSGGQPPYTYFWSSFVTTEDASNLTAGTYSVVISDSNGCTLIDTVTIPELAAGGACSTGTDTVGVVLPYFVPNVFTPNGDGNNDVFLVFVKDPAKTNIRIFNRFGGQVYYNGDLNTVYGSTDGWDGMYNGKEAPEATYVYMINIDYVDPGKDDEQLTGSITLVR